LDKTYQLTENTELVGIMKKMYEEIEENNIAAEAASDVLWEYTNLEELLRIMQEKNANAYLILLHMLLTCTY